MSAAEFKRRLSDLDVGDHLYLLYADDEERLAGLAPAVEEALRRGHRCLYFAAADAVRSALDGLEERGLDPVRLREDGSLEVVFLEEVRDADGSLQLEAVVELAMGHAEEAAGEGHDGLWWIVEIPWHWLPLVRGEDIRDFEARLFDALGSRPIVALCQFDRRRLSDELLAEVLRAHPLAVLGDEVYPNPYYVPPEAVLDEYEITRTDWMLRQLERARATETRLRRSEDRLRTILERAPDIIARYDDQLRYLYANPVIERYTGLTPDELVGTTLGTPSADTDALDPWREGIRHALETGAEQTVEGPLDTREMGKRWFQTRIVPEPGSGGEPDTVLILARDVTETHRARQEAEETARLFRKTLASLTEAVFVVDPTDRTIIYCNEAAEEIFGHERSQMVGSDTRMLHVDEEAFRRFGEESEDVLERRESYRAEDRMRRADGSVFPTEHRVTLLDSAEGPEAGVVSVVRDVTEEREAREAIELYAERLESLRELDRAILGARSEGEVLEAATGRIRELLGSWRVSVLLVSRDSDSYLLASSTEGVGSRVARSDAGGRATDLLEALEFGSAYCEEDVLNGDGSGIPVPESRDLVEQGLRSVFSVPLVVEGQRLGALNVGYQEPDGFSEMTVEVAREMATHMGLALRQTRLLQEVDRATAERNAAERRAERLQVRLDDLLDELDLGVGRVDEEGTYLSVNEAYARLLGYDSPREIESRNVRDLLVRPGMWDGIEDQLRGEDGFLPEMEFQMRRADGSTIWVAGWGRRMEIPEDEVVFEGMVRDVTEQKRLQEQILAIGAEERRRIGRELHDQLGQQLTGIAFLARTLAGRGDGEEVEAASEAATARRIEEEAREAITRMRHLARGLDPGELDDQGLGEALEELATESRRLFGVNVEVSVDSGVDFGGDEPLHLYRIAQEAVTNAVRHGDARRIEIRAATRDGRRVLEIRDDGSGMEASAPDEGLGLRTMRYRCESLGGELTIEFGEGTTVRCLLPAEPTPSRTGGGIP